MDEVKIVPISKTHQLGEGPHWVEKDQSLIYVDIPEGNVCRYFHDTKKSQALHLDDVGTGKDVSFILPIEETTDHFVAGVGTSVASFQWSSKDPDFQTKKPKHLLSVEPFEQNTRVNDAKCDPAGRIFTGTMGRTHVSPFPKYVAGLYRIDPNLKPSTLLDKISLSNGLAWSSDNTIFYYIDSLEYRVDAFDYDITTGNISSRRTVLDFQKYPGVNGIPDGMCIDQKGNLWVACYGAFQIICVDPNAMKIIKSVDIPSRKVTSCCWGGKDLSTLFVTSASVGEPKEFDLYPDSGKTFAVTGLEVKGLPPANFRVDNLALVK